MKKFPIPSHLRKIILFYLGGNRAPVKSTGLFYTECNLLPFLTDYEDFMTTGIKQPRARFF